MSLKPYTPDQAPDACYEEAVQPRSAAASCPLALPDELAHRRQQQEAKAWILHQILVMSEGDIKRSLVAFETHDRAIRDPDLHNPYKVLFSRILLEAHGLASDLRSDPDTQTPSAITALGRMRVVDKEALELAIDEAFATLAEAGIQADTTDEALPYHAPAHHDAEPIPA